MLHKKIRAQMPASATKYERVMTYVRGWERLETFYLAHGAAWANCNVETKRLAHDVETVTRHGDTSARHMHKSSIQKTLDNMT
ncbi:MAG: hypothetical protein AAGJ35_00420, partial [Myxococcota bacterium]